MTTKVDAKLRVAILEIEAAISRHPYTGLTGEMKGKVPTTRWGTVDRQGYLAGLAEAKYLIEKVTKEIK